MRLRRAAGRGPPEWGRGRFALRTVWPYTLFVEIDSARHRGLHHLIEDGGTRFLPPALVDRVQKIVATLLLAEGMDEFRAAASPGWRVHQLTGARDGEWSVSVSANWRVTFHEINGRIERINLEDYH